MQMHGCFFDCPQTQGLFEKSEADKSELSKPSKLDCANTLRYTGLMNATVDSDPELQQVEPCHSPTQRQLIGSGGFLDGEQLLPGFKYADLFKEWDWE